MKDFTNRLLDWCDKTIKIFGWKSMEEMEAEYAKTGRREIFTDEWLMEATYKAKSESESHPGRNISALYQFLFNTKKTCFNDFISFRKLEDFSQKSIADSLELINHINGLIELYDDWKSQAFDVALSNASKLMNLGSIDIDPSILVDIHKLITSNTFNCYKYVDTGEKLGYDDKFYISSIIGLSTDLTVWLNSIKSQPEFFEAKSRDEVYVTVFGRIDQINPIYSNWLFTIHKGSTIWVVSDDMMFNNPYQKHARLARKSVWDKANEKYANCDLPYEMFHNLEDVRKSQKSVANSDNHIAIELDIKNVKKEDIKSHISEKLVESGVDFTSIQTNPLDYWTSKFEWASIKLDGDTIGTYIKDSNHINIYRSPEILYVNTSTIKDEQLVFLNLLTSEFIQYFSIKQDGLKTIQLAGEFINDRLESGDMISPMDGETRMTYFTDEIQEIVNEKLEAVDVDGKSTALVPKSYDLVKVLPNFDNSWLATTDRLDSYTEWLVLEEERVVAQAKLDKLKDLYKEGMGWLADTLESKKIGIKNKIGVAKKFSVKSKSVNTFGSYQTPDTNEVVITRLDWPKGGGKRRAEYEGCGINKSDYGDQICDCGRGYRLKRSTIIRINSHRGLCWLLDLDNKNELHPYFRQYRFHGFIPYPGNSLLDQTHPYTRLKDPCSDRYPNGIILTYYLCGQCNHELGKSMEELVELKLGKDYKA